MATVIRLSRGGAKKRPFYRVVVTDNRAPRDGDFIERLGTFNPLLPKDAQRLTINEERAKHWLSKGAQPSDRVTKLFAELNLVEKPDYTGKPVKTRKKADKSTRAEKRAADAEAAKEQAKADAEAAKEAAKAAAEAPAEAPADAAVAEETPAA